MSISRDEVERIARLARLALDEEEIEVMTRDLGAILAYVEKLGAVSALEGDPAEGATSAPTPLREDEARVGLPPGEATARAPGAHQDLFRVPPVLGGD